MGNAASNSKGGKANKPLSKLPTDDDSPAARSSPERGISYLQDFKYEKGVCALSWWQPIKLLEEGSISDIHLCRRRHRFVHVRYKEKRDIMKFAKTHAKERRPPRASDDGGEEGPDDGRLYVLKSIMKDYVGDDKIMEEMRREIHTMSALDHPNVIRLYEAYERRRHVYLVLEYCPGGNLADISDGLNEAQTRFVMYKLLDAVVYLHGRGVVHRDLKLENVMLDARGEIKIIDFGLATKYLSEEHRNMTDRVGTLYSMAPQVIAGTYDSKCDIWSLGVVAYVLLSKGVLPFWGPTYQVRWVRRRKMMIENIKRGNYQSMTGPRWDGITAEAKDFVASLLQLRPDRRPTAARALREHEWMRRMPRNDVTGMPPPTLSDKRGNRNSMRVDFRRRVWQLLSTKLSLEEILDLVARLEAQEQVGDGRMPIETFCNVLTSFSSSSVNLSSQDTETLMENESSIREESIDYVDLMIEVLAGRGRNMIDDVALGLDNLDVQGQRRLPIEAVRSVLDAHLPPAMKSEVLNELDTADDDGGGLVSTVQVLETTGKYVARHQRHSIRMDPTEET